MTEAFELLGRQRQAAVVLTILQQTIFHVVFSAHLNKVGRDANAREFRSRIVETRIAARINTVRKGHNSSPAADLFARSVAKDLIGYAGQGIVKRCSIAGSDFGDGLMQGPAIAGK